MKQIIRDTDKSQYFAITEFNNIVLRFDHQINFLMNICQEVKWSAIFHARAIAGRRKVWFHFMHEQNIICSQTQLDNIAHEQTIIRRQFFATQMMGFQPIKRKNFSIKI